MIDPRLSWFTIGATCGAVLFGWPWHPRFSRYGRMQDPDWRRSFNHENTNRPSGPPPFNLRRKDDPSAPGMRRITTTPLMTEQEHRAVLYATTVIAKRSFDDGVRAAAGMIRIAAAAANPPTSLEMVAKLIEATVTSDQA